MELANDLFAERTDGKRFDGWRNTSKKHKKAEAND